MYISRDILVISFVPRDKSYHVPRDQWTSFESFDLIKIWCDTFLEYIFVVFSLRFYATLLLPACCVYVRPSSGARNDFVEQTAGTRIAIFEALLCYNSKTVWTRTINFGMHVHIDKGTYTVNFQPDYQCSWTLILKFNFCNACIFAIYTTLSSERCCAKYFGLLILKCNPS